MYHWCTTEAIRAPRKYGINCVKLFLHLSDRHTLVYDDVGVFIALMLVLKDGEAILAGGFDGFYTYFASDAVSYASNPQNWPALGRSEVCGSYS